MSWFCCDEDDERDERIITPGQQNLLYSTNEVRNSKYTLVSFLPLNLYEQFRRPLNRYFLLVACLQFIPVIAPVSPISTLLPLALAFLLTAAKEGYDDLQRHRADFVANNTLYHVWRHGRVQLVPCKDIRVGDLVKVMSGQEFPCDVFLVYSSDVDGMAYIETANLDGESDLKSRSCVAEVTAQVGRISGERPPAVSFTLQAEPPSNLIYTFIGSIVMNYEEIPVTSQQLLQQACYLRNTDWVWALAVYTGHQTKVNMNKSGPTAKWAKVDRLTSQYSIVIFCIQLLYAICCGTAGSYLAFEEDQWYLSRPEISREVLWHYIVYPGRFFLLTSVMIPISFKVITDISKYWISLCIAWDLTMYDEATDTPAGVEDSAIAEDLGQIQVILSDKTGTLTENVMQFKCCTIEGVVYGWPPSAPAACDLEEVAEGSFNDSELQRRLGNGDEGVLTFFRALALCHSVIPKRVEGQLVYHGSSPDEEALVLAAMKAGVVLTHRTKDTMEIDVLGCRERYDVLETLDFTSDRKRMGVVVRNLETDAITLLVKGADDKVMERLASPNSSGIYEAEEVTEPLGRDMANLSLFASNGLRTLCVAYRVLSEDAFRAWRVEYLKAKVARGDRRAKDLATACDKLEMDLHFVGASAIEDRLQDAVPETIQALQQAGITLWMLTGDKFETAKQVAISCSLLPEQEECLVVVGSTCSEVIACLKDIQFKYHRHAERRHLRCIAPPGAALLRTEPTFREAAPLLPRSVSTPPTDDELSQSWQRNSLSNSAGSLPDKPIECGKGYVLMVSGDTLELAMQDECRALFLSLSLAASAVVCCRTTPPIKAAVTRMVKEAGMRTLAIGDGGNDVAMLQEADVGVGISGKEGLQAARAADYSIAKFKYLRPLLLVHGHYSYQRTCYIVQYCFYKSMLLSFIQLLFNLFCHFSGLSLWDAFQLFMFNGLFTLAPIFFYVLDRSVPRPHLEAHPRLYRHTQGDGGLNARTFTSFLWRAQLQAAAGFFLSLTLLGAGYTSVDGHPADMWKLSVTVYSALMSLQVAVLLMESNTIALLNQVAIWGTFVLYWITMVVYCAVPSTEQYHVMDRLLVEPDFFLLQLLLLVVMAFPMLTWRFVEQNYFPSDLQLHRQQALRPSRWPHRSNSTASSAPYSMSVRDSRDEIVVSVTPNQ
eukprot:EG_transcript_593